MRYSLPFSNANVSTVYAQKRGNFGNRIVSFQVGV